MSKRIEIITKDRNIGKRELLCSCVDCFYKTDNKNAKAKKLCPFCQKIGYCSVVCFNMDILRHVLNNCGQEVKKVNYIDND